MAENKRITMPGYSPLVGPEELQLITPSTTGRGPPCSMHEPTTVGRGTCEIASLWPYIPEIFEESTSA